jgi:ATP-dependent helicase HrpA
MIFPGSNVFKTSPKWIMAAEMVETSRLFARQVAKIDVQWLEPMCTDLAKFSYAEPHWSKNRGAVMAYMTMTLYGLPIVTRRLVNYSNIDKVVSRELFIREALVNCQTKLNYAFLSHNQAQIQEVELLEKKARRRDLLADEETLCLFYDERLPQDINNEASFKKWWSKHQHAQADKFKFDHEVLLKRDPSEVGANDYPDMWHQGNLHLPISYHFEPNQSLDGLAVHIPIPLLNQVHEVGFDWLVPGMRHELITSLIKSLPKRLRRNFVPAPDYAKAVLADISMVDSSGAPVAIVDALSLKLFRMSGVKVNPEDFDPNAVESHLQCNFVIEDASRKIKAQGKSLNALKMQLKGELKQSLDTVATPELEVKDVNAWDFGALPEQFTQKQAGYEVKAYVALVHEKNQVNVSLIDNPVEAAIKHKRGLYELIKKNVPSPVKYLQEKLPNKAKLSLYFNPFGQIKPLIDDIILASIDALVTAQYDPLKVRDETTFKQICELVRSNINDQALSIAKQVESGLALANQVNKHTKGNIPLNMINQVKHLQGHVNQLVFKGFVYDLGIGRLDDWNRYLRALVYRAEKVKVDPNRDRINQLEIDKAQDAYDGLMTDYKNKHMDVRDIDDIRWMIEELRVSLFAQQVGTKFPISLKRIMNRIAQG